METLIKADAKIDGEIEEILLELEGKSDFELRKLLVGSGITSSLMARQYYNIESEEFRYMCIKLTEKLSSIYQNATKDTKKFKVEIEYRSKSNPEIFGFSSTEEERTEEEVRKRIENRKFENLKTGKRIKPIFTKYEITLTQN